MSDSTQTGGLPRMCGDDPDGADLNQLVNAFAPHVRG